MSTLSEYEKQRLENIRRNKEVLAKLNIAPLTPSVSSLHLSKKKGLFPKTHAKNHVPLEPTRKSARLQEKTLEQTNDRGNASKLEFASLDDLVPNKKETKEPVRSIVGPIPFTPQVGATTDFLNLMKSIPKSKSTPVDVDDSSIWTLALPHCITKVLRSRIYSIAVHPNTEKTIVAVGGKMGELGIWDATDVLNTALNTPLIVDYEDISSMTPIGGKLCPYTDFEPSIFTFQPHRHSDSGSISNLRYLPNKTHNLLSTSYDGSIRCMNIEQGVFDDVYTCEDLIYGIDLIDDNTWWFSHGNGLVTLLDTRQSVSEKSPNFKLHQVKIGSISMDSSRNLLCTASNDRTVCIWDIRKLRTNSSKPIIRLEDEFSRAITSAYFHPMDSSIIMSTCYDNFIRLHNIKDHKSTVMLSLSHNNQTGKWITPFRAQWDPKSSLKNSCFVCGDMDKTLDLYYIKDDWKLTEQFVASPMLTSQPAVNCVHPVRHLVCSGNASGKIILWNTLKE